MIECMILGDSIAQGVSTHLPECQHRTQVGITSQQFVRRFTQPVEARHVLISLGSNDGTSALIQDHLQLLRQSITSPRVTWLVSVNNTRAGIIVQEIARVYGDHVLHVAPVVGSDGVHPTSAGYRQLAQMWVRN